MYCGIVEVPKKRLEDVLHAAKHLQIKGLFNSTNSEGSNQHLPFAIHQKNEGTFCQRSYHDVMVTKSVSIQPSMVLGQEEPIMSSNLVTFSHGMPCNSNANQENGESNCNLRQINDWSIHFDRTKDAMKSTETEISDVVRDITSYLND